MKEVEASLLVERLTHVSKLNEWFQVVRNRLWIVDSAVNETDNIKMLTVSPTDKNIIGKGGKKFR